MYIYIFASVSSFFLRQARYVFRQIQSTFEQIPRLLGLCQLSFIPLLSVLLVEIRSQQKRHLERDCRVISFISALPKGLYVAYNLCKVYFPKICLSFIYKGQIFFLGWIFLSPCQPILLENVNMNLSLQLSAGNHVISKFIVTSQHL